MEAWNPLPPPSGTTVSDALAKVEVLSACGPIHIDSPVITDEGETRNFTAWLDSAGQRTCVRADWGEGTVEYMGNPTSCRMRYPNVTDEEVVDFDHQERIFARGVVYP